MAKIVEDMPAKLRIKPLKLATDRDVVRSNDSDATV